MVLLILIPFQYCYGSASKIKSSFVLVPSDVLRKNENCFINLYFTLFQSGIRKHKKKNSHRPFLSFLYLIFKNFIILTHYKYSYRLLTWPAIAWAFSVVLFLLVLWALAVLLWPQLMCLHHAVLSVNLLWLQVSLPFPPDVWKEQEIPLQSSISNQKNSKKKAK